MSLDELTIWATKRGRKSAEEETNVICTRITEFCIALRTYLESEDEKSPFPASVDEVDASDASPLDPTDIAWMQRATVVMIEHALESRSTTRIFTWQRNLATKVFGSPTAPMNTHHSLQLVLCKTMGLI